MSKSIEVLQIGGWIDTLAINPDILDADKAKLKAGVGVAIDNNGFVTVCTDNSSSYLQGFLVNDATWESCVNVATDALEGSLAVIAGGGLFATDNVVEDDIRPGDLLYLDADGVITKASGNGEAFGVAKTGNNTTDKTIVVRF